MNTQLQRRWNLTIAKNANHKRTAPPNDPRTILMERLHKTSQDLVTEAHKQGFKAPYMMLLSRVEAAMEVNDPAKDTDLEGWNRRSETPALFRVDLFAADGQELSSAIDPIETEAA